jgi:4-amino-4-deoxy-L-arabinose transferase-like glycosyltransferase
MSAQNPIQSVQRSFTHHRWLALILVLAFILRLVYAVSQDMLAPYSLLTGGDTWWYFDHGYKLVQGTITGAPPSAPLYLIAAGGAQQVFGPGSGGAVLALRLMQVFMGTATCYFAYRMATLIGADRAGLLAAGVLAVSPTFIIEAAQLLTETLYIFLLSGGLLAYLELIRRGSKQGYSGVVLVALLLALATMTRAVLLLFPLGLAVHLLLVYGWRRGLKWALVLLTVYTMVCSIWTIYNQVRWNIRVIGAQGLSAFLFIGAEGWQPPDQIDEALAESAGGQLPTDPKDQQEIYQNAAATSILSDVPGWITHRVSELLAAYAQPHGTTFFPGESLKDLTLNWWSHDRTISGLLRLTAGEQFWPKLAIYIFYYVGLLAGLVGLWVTRRNSRFTLPLAGFIVYTTLIHLLLDALPRYLFPLTMIWWIFASTALLAAWDRIRVKANRVHDQQPAHQPQQ